MATTNILTVNDNSINGMAPVATHSYVGLSSDGIKTFVQQCLSDNFWDNVSKGFTQPLDFVNYIRVFPYNVVDTLSTTSMDIKVGNLTYRIDSGKYGPCKSKIHITKHFQNIFGSTTRFNQAYPYVQVDCYLPYVGFINLDINELRDSGDYIKVDLVIDVLSGYGIYSISRFNKDINEWFVFYTTQTNFGTEIPVGGTNTATQAQKIFNNITQSLIGMGTTAIGAATGNAFAISGGIATTAGGLVDSVNNANETVISRGTNGNYPTSFNNPHAIYFIVRKKKVNDYDSFKSFYGKPLNQKKALSELNGITFIPNPKITIDNITKEEVDLLNARMKDGIIL